jgi:hypothetical protein
MSRFYYVYLVSCLIGLLGSILVIIGFFSPFRITSLPAYPDVIDSFWTMLADTVTGPVLNLPLGIGIGIFLLSMLIPFLASLAGLLDVGKQVLHRSSRVFAILGLLELLIVSPFLLSRLTPDPPFAAHSTSAMGPGEWLMLGGFLVSIGGSIAQNALFKTRETLIEPPSN